jgi:hypothetical protein
VHCVMWTYAVPPDLDEPVIREQFQAVTERWGAAPLRHEWVVPVVAESAVDQVVTEQSVTAQ